MNNGDGDWLLDLGNTRLKLAQVTASQARFIGAWALDGAALPEETRRLLAASAPGSRAWLGSSTDAGVRHVMAAAIAALGVEVRIVATPAHCRRLRIAYVEPARLGVDRFLALLAASERDDGPWLVTSVGSALTVDLLAADGLHLGGLIALSPQVHRQALAERIPHLEVSGGVACAFAADTADALASGAQASALGLIERSLDNAQTQLGRRPTLLLTGGGAKSLMPHLAPVVWLPTLVLDGLALYAQTFASLPS